MKTNSLQHFRQSHSRRRLALVVVVVAICWYVFYTPLQAAVSYVSAPLSGVRSWWITSESTIPLYFRSRSVLEERLSQLAQERDRVSYDRDRLAVLEAEHTLLKKQMRDGGDDRIIAGVLRRPDETPYDTVVIDAGTGAGVVEGALVYADRAVVGVVARALPQSALVTLFSSPQVESPLFIYGPNIFARGIGMGGGVVRVGVAQGIKLTVGDPVVVPLSESAIYGHVDHIETDPSNPEQYAYVVQIPQLQNMRFVAVAKTALPQWSIEEAHTAMRDAETRLMGTSTSIGLFVRTLPVASTTATSSESL